MPFGSVNFEVGLDANGERCICLPRAVRGKRKKPRARETRTGQIGAPRAGGAIN
jgi:hypothetical protein